MTDMIREDIMHAADVVAREYRNTDNEALANAAEAAASKLENMGVDLQTVKLMLHSINAHEYQKQE